MKRGDPSISVNHGKSISFLRCDSQGILHLNRTIQTATILDDTDAYGGFWLFAIADVPKNLVRVSVGRGEHQLQGKIGFYVPPYAIMRWRINPGRLRFRAFIGEESLIKEHGLVRPMLIPLAGIDDVENLQSITPILTGAKHNYELNLDKPHVVVRQAKGLIDQNYQTSCSITEIANELRIDRTSLSRMFKDWYGIPPIVYRNRMRVFYSKFRLLKGESSVATAGHNAGFDDLASFNRQFKRVIGGVPSQFRLTK